MTTALTVGAAAFSTFAQIRANQARSAEEARLAEYRAQVAANNQAIAEQNARVARERASIEAFDQDIENLAVLGALEAAQAASGLSGRSQSRAIATQRRTAAQERNRIIFQGETEAHAAETQAQSFATEAEFEEYNASQARRRGRASVLPSLIGGATSILRAGRFGQGLLVA